MNRTYEPGEWILADDGEVHSVCAGQGVPFRQWLAVCDARTPASHLAMNGFVAAVDDPIWEVWKQPVSGECRCCWSPIPYTEAIRQGWAKRVTVKRKPLIVYTQGPRPLGPPPEVKDEGGCGG